MADASGKSVIGESKTSVHRAKGETITCANLNEYLIAFQGNNIHCKNDTMYAVGLIRVGNGGYTTGPTGVQVQNNEIPIPLDTSLEYFNISVNGGGYFEVKIKYYYRTLNPPQQM